MRQSAPRGAPIGRSRLAVGLALALWLGAAASASADETPAQPLPPEPGTATESQSAAGSGQQAEDSAASAASPATDAALPAAEPVAADTPLPAPPEAIAAVEGHFAAILGRDYRSADSWFSEAYLDAFKADVARINEYYIARFAQLSRGHSVVESALLSDPGRLTARVTVDFNPPDPEAPVLVTERMHYYLTWEKGADGTPGRDGEGRAWRIDIYDAFRHDSLAEARRRPYLYTRQAWAEDGGRELKSRQGLFRLQWALDSYAADRGGYPERLVGGDSKKDPLISGGYFAGVYPPNGWDNAAMAAVNIDERSSGDFTYLPLDTDSDGRFDDYWLLLHGKRPENYYYGGTDIIYVLSAAADADQREMGQAFAAWWGANRGTPLADGPGLVALAPPELSTHAAASPEADTVPPASADAGPVLPGGAPTAAAADAEGPPAAGGQPSGAAQGSAAAAGVLRCRDRLLRRPAAPPDPPQATSAAKAWIPGEGDYPPLKVWSYGFR